MVVAPNGCAVLLYLERPDDRHLRGWPRSCGPLPGVEVMFSGVRGASVVDGTLPLSLLQIDGPLAPDLLVTLAWSDDANEHGYRGVSYELGSNQASHGGASAWEIRNTLILQGPGIASGLALGAAIRHLDLAPTVLSLLGLPVPASMTGRVLGEATVGGRRERRSASLGGDRRRGHAALERGRRPRYLSAVSRRPPRDVVPF